MDNKTVIKQLEKALACKEDKELRLRVEVLVDMLKEIKDQPSFPTPVVPPTPSYKPYYDQTPTPKPPYRITAKPTKGPNGPGAIISSGEQINYTRPEGT